MRRLLTLIAVALTALVAVSACGGDDSNGPADAGPAVEAVDSVVDDLEEDDLEEDDLEEDDLEEPGPGDESPVEDDDKPQTDVADPQALLAAAATVHEGRSFRGATRIEAPVEMGGPESPTTTFEFAPGGDVAVRIDIPAGSDPEFPLEGADAEVRYVGDVTYVRPPFNADLGIEGDVWLVIPDAAGAPAPDDALAGVLSPVDGLACILPQMPAAGQSGCDPLSEIAGLLSLATNAEVVGHEQLRDVQTTRVRFVAPANSLDPASGGTVGDGSSGSDGLDQSEVLGLGGGGLTTEAWVDDDGRLRQVSIDLFSMFGGLAADAGEAIPSFLLIVEFYDFDAAVSVEAPPAELIIDDPPDLFGLGGGGAGEPES